MIQYIVNDLNYFRIIASCFCFQMVKVTHASSYIFYTLILIHFMYCVNGNFIVIKFEYNPSTALLAEF